MAVIEVPESYTTLNVALAEIRKEVEWFLGGDWKFLACVCGL